MGFSDAVGFRVLNVSGLGLRGFRVSGRFWVSVFGRFRV